MGSENASQISGIKGDHIGIPNLKGQRRVFLPALRRRRDQETLVNTVISTTYIIA